MPEKNDATPSENGRARRKPYHARLDSAPRPRHGFSHRPAGSTAYPARPMRPRDEHSTHAHKTAPSYITAPAPHGHTPRAATHSPHRERSRSSRNSRMRPLRGKPAKGGPIHRMSTAVTKLPSIAAGNIRIVPLGGVEEIGKNMTAIEFGDDIIVVDAGLQFKEDETPGIDYILPNTKYLEERREKIRALIVTHGHLDHIGAIPYVMERIGNPPVYTRLLTSIMIKKRQEEFPTSPPLKMNVVEKDAVIRVGALRIRFFSVTHTIPDSMGVIIETPYGLIVHTGDLKLDHIDGVPTEREEQEYGVFKNEKVLLLMADSTNVELPGFSMPERTVQKNLEEIVKNTKGRLIIGTFASLLERIMKIIEFAEASGKRVVIEGRSMKSNVEIVRELGLLKVKKETIISTEEMEQFPPERIVMLATGAQGDEFAALMRMANKTHKNVRITKRDTIVLSSSIVPGNERSVQRLKDSLSRQGARIVHYKVADVHSSGHANRDETAWIHARVNPKFFIPLHGYHYMLRVHADIEIARGTPEKNVIIPDNGALIEIQESGEKIVTLKDKAPSGLVLVDGFSVGDIQEVVIRDRQMLSQDGMFVIIANVSIANGKLKKSPDIISRGFVYLRESQDLLSQTRLIIKKTIEDLTANMRPIDFEYVKEHVTDNVSRFLFQKTAKRPIVIPVIIGA